METCRTCARSDFENGNNWLDLFHSTRWQCEIEQIRMEFANWKLKISPNDGLPQKICSDCFTKFCSICTFRLACQDAQLKLSNIFDKIDARTLEDESEQTTTAIEMLAHETVSITTTQTSTTEINTAEKPTTIALVELINAAVDAATIDEQPPLEPTETDVAELIEEDVTEEWTAEFNITNDEDLLNNISYACKYCLKPTQQYQTQQALLEHITNMHDEQQPYNCPECKVCFQDAASRTIHIKDQHVEKHYACVVCGKKYGDRFNLRHHVEKYHSETDFECNMCEKRFFTRKSLNYHMKWHNPERQLKCGYCDRLFINQRHLKCHEATHTGLRKCEFCTYCGKSFIHLKTLRWHIYRQHNGEKPYKCGHCTEVFASYAEKRIHMLGKHAANLTAIERSECMICRKQYVKEADLYQHMQLEHVKSKIKTLVINNNNKRMLQPKREKQYSGLFQCGACDQRFNMKTALERHSAVHSIEGRPHACPQCSKRFKRAQDLKWHLKTHAVEKPNICDVCGKGFALKYVMTQHKRSHEVLEKNFKCVTCGRAYLFEKSLRLHERTHTGNTFYKCDICSDRFVTHIKFKCHMQKSHGSNENSSPKKTLPKV